MPSRSPSYPGLAIVVPVYNEGSRIGDSCRAIAAVARRYSGRAAVVAVDDGSRDESATVLKELAAACELLDYVRHGSNQGYGSASRTGAAWAKSHGFDYVAFIDSDLTNPPEDLLKIGPLAEAGAPYMKASRYVRGGGATGVPLRRRAVSRLGNHVGSFLYGLPTSDVTNGFRAARTDLYCGWPLRETGFAIIMEEVYWALVEGVAIATFPTVLRARDASQRVSAFAYTPRVMRDYLRYPLRSFARRQFATLRRRQRPLSGGDRTHDGPNG